VSPSDRRPFDDDEDEREPVVITDKRKVDRGDRAAAGPVSEPEAAPSEPEPAIDENAKLLAERTADLAAGELAIGRVLVDFLPVLDNFDRAEEHGDLTGGLKAIADQLVEIFNKLGLASFGQVGDPFDPSIHEAVLHDESPDVEEPTCTTVMRPGYKHNDRLLRAAMVGVSDPATPPAPPVEDAQPEIAEQVEEDDEE
jgi:molecular chaperone GrpE